MAKAKTAPARPRSFSSDPSAKAGGPSGGLTSGQKGYAARQPPKKGPGLPSAASFGGPGAKQAVKGAGAKGPIKGGPTAAAKPKFMTGKAPKGTQGGFGIGSQITKGMTPKGITQLKAGIRSAMAGEPAPKGRGVNQAFKAGHAFGRGVGKPGRPKKLVQAFLGRGGTGSHE